MTQKSCRNLFFALLASVILIATLSSYGASNSESALTIDSSLIAPVEQTGKAYEAIAEHVKPSVVSVFSERIVRLHRWDFPFSFGEDFFNEFFGGDGPRPRKQSPSREYKIPQMGMGSGMVIDREGHILTNYHVVQNVDQIKVQFSDQKILKAKIIGVDPKTDVAVIQVVKGPISSSQPIVALGDSSAVKVGQIVLAIGSPFGLSQTVTHGIISAVGRADVGIADYEDFIQTDAPINPGNSGGPLVNIRGEVIGMNSAIATSIGQSGGVGFAIPSNMIKAMLPRLIKGEKITRGELGIGIQNINDDLVRHLKLKDTKGILVSQVTANSPAEKAGIKLGDVVVQYEGKPVENINIFRNLVSATAPGTKVKIDILRNQKLQTIRATIGQQKIESEATAPNENEESSTLDRLGISVETLTKDMARQFYLKDRAGVIITEVVEGSMASIHGLQVGDLIVEVNKKPVRKASDFLEVVNNLKDESVLLLIKRRDASLYVVLPVVM